MKWITALDLQKWASTIAARTSMPSLIGDLIRASSPEIRSFRFPSGDKGQVRGFDGWLEATGMPPYVPDGVSLWEFGVAGEKPTKALSDYKKRTQQVDEKQRAQTTFVFVSPDTWDNPTQKLQDWVSDVKADKQWKDVRYIDGTQLEDWLALRPAVASRYAVELSLKPQVGARSADEFWDEYSHRFRTRLTEDVLLAGRADQATSVLQRLMDVPSGIELAADSPDEVIAFAIAAVRRSDAPTRMYLEDRILIVDTEEAARFFASSENLIYFPRSQANQLSGLLATRGPTLLSRGRDQPLNREATLASPSTADFGKALESMGLDRDAANGLAREAGRSITVLSRRFPGGTSPKPEWMKRGADLLPALLAGGWDGANSADRSALLALTTGGDYSALEKSLRELSRTQDPPIDLTGELWTVRAPVDLFIHIGHLLGSSELEALEIVVTDVFAQTEPDPDPDAPFGGLANKARYSGLLREGLANTLLQIAVLGKQADLNVPGVKPDHWVEEVIGRIPGLRDNSRLIASIRDQLWLLMEAAPRPLLGALEHLLEGDGEQARALFSTDAGFLAPSSPHIYVLWALETLSWDPSYLERALKILAGLAAVDPGGQTSNRPLNSLRSILLAWSPNTYARVGQRNSALEMIVENYPDVGWRLLLELLPKYHDTNTPTRKPRFREAGASNAEVLTNRMVWDAQAFVIDLALQQTGEDEDRWISIIERIDEWPRDAQQKALSLVDDWLSNRDSPSVRVWQALSDLANRHQAFSDAEWSLPPEAVQGILELARKHEPADVVSRVRWLFDSWSPPVPGGFDAEEAVLKRLRSDALTEVLAARGIGGLFELLETAETAVLAVAASDHAADVYTLREYVVSALRLNTDAGRAFARIASARAYDRHGEQWWSELDSASDLEKWTEADLALLMLNWPDERQVWDYVDLHGKEVSENYWKNKPAFPTALSASDTKEAIDRYLKAGRASAAIVSSSRQLAEVSTDEILSMLQAYISEINASGGAVNQMSSYYVSKLFEELDERKDIQSTDVARLEYAYLPLLEDRKKVLTINRLMANDPGFYVSLLSSVFRPKSAKDDDQEQQPDVKEQQRIKWRQDYRLLTQFTTVPGASDSQVDYDVLNSWVKDVRRLGLEADRAEITDSYVGHLLAHAPSDNTGNWPPSAVSRLLQELQSDDIENGIQTERHNMRGVYTKSLYEGGAQERELAATYRGWSKLAETTSSRTSQLLERIARSWEDDAEREDRRAEMDKLRD